MTRSRFPLLAALAVCLFVSSARAQNLVLVENGVSRAPVVIFENAPPYTRQAADELAEYIEKTSGAKPEVIEGRPDPLPESAVWVGYQPVLDDLFPNLDFDFQHREEILIAASENHLVIAGRDVWDPDLLVTVIEGRNSTIEGWQQEYGTVNAVYTFLQDYLDVRWLWPGELGEDIVERDTISFAPFERRHHLQIWLRSGILRFSAPGDSRGISHDWVRFQRLQLDGSRASHQLLDIIGGHGFGDWWDRFGETHNEYFALQPDGTRSGFPGPRTAKLCQTNPGVWTQWLADVEARIEDQPDRIIFSGSPNDSYHRGHCICENCRAWDHPDAEQLQFVWQGLAQPYVALSDRHVTFANRLGRKLRERFPDRDYYALMYAYGNSRPAPIEARPDDNVIMCSVANFHLRGHASRAQHLRQFEGWGQVSKNLMWRPNLGNAYGWSWGFPAGSPAQAIGDMKFVAEMGCVGIYFDSTWEHWATQGLHYYLLAQLAWDASQDGEELMADYFRRGFGPAADDVRAYWELVSGVRDALPSESVSGLREAYQEQRVIARAGEILDHAAAAVADGPDIYRERVAFVRAGIDYTGLAMDIMPLVARFRQSDGADTDAAREAEEKWAQIEEIRERFPLALHWRRVGRGTRTPMPASWR